MESGVYNLGGQFCHRYIIPRSTRHIVQSSLKVQDGVSFFLKMESARPVPFLLHNYFRKCAIINPLLVPLRYKSSSTQNDLLNALRAIL